MLSVVPLVAVAAVILVGSFENLRVQDKVAESQVIVEETMQGISIVKAFANGMKIARYDGKKKRSSSHQGGKYRGYLLLYHILSLEQS
jgi:hypothetical protein